MSISVQQKERNVEGKHTHTQPFLNNLIYTMIEREREGGIRMIDPSFIGWRKGDCRLAALKLDTTVWRKRDHVTSQHAWLVHHDYVYRPETLYLFFFVGGRERKILTWHQTVVGSGPNCYVFFFLSLLSYVYFAKGGSSLSHYGMLIHLSSMWIGLPQFLSGAQLFFLRSK